MMIFGVKKRLGITHSITHHLLAKLTNKKIFFLFEDIRGKKLGFRLCKNYCAFVMQVENRVTRLSRNKDQ